LSPWPCTKKNIKPFFHRTFFLPSFFKLLKKNPYGLSLESDSEKKEGKKKKETFFKELIITDSVRQLENSYVSSYPTGGVSPEDAVSGSERARDAVGGGGGWHRRRVLLLLVRAGEHGVCRGVQGAGETLPEDAAAEAAAAAEELQGEAGGGGRSRARAEVHVRGLRRHHGRGVRVPALHRRRRRRGGAAAAERGGE